MGKIFNYADPDNRPVRGAAVATIEISIGGDNLCVCGKDGLLTIEIEVEVSGSGGKSPWTNFNKIAREAGEFIVDANKVQFAAPKATDPNSPKAKATHVIKLPECPDKENPEKDQEGKGEIKVVDLTRKGATVGEVTWTGVSQIYQYSWSYRCERTGKDGRCVECKQEKKLQYDVKLLKANTVQPNL